MQTVQSQTQSKQKKKNEKQRGAPRERGKRADFQSYLCSMLDFSVSCNFADCQRSGLLNSSARAESEENIQPKWKCKKWHRTRGAKRCARWTEKPYREDLTQFHSIFIKTYFVPERELGKSFRIWFRGFRSEPSDRCAPNSFRSSPKNSIEWHSNEYKCARFHPNK